VEDACKNIENRKVLNKFRGFIEAPGVNPEYVDNPNILINAEFVIPLVSYEDGIVHKIHAENVRIIVTF